MDDVCFDFGVLVLCSLNLLVAKSLEGLRIDLPLGQVAGCARDDEDMCIKLVEGITLVQLFP